MNNNKSTQNTTKLLSAIFSFIDKNIYFKLGFIFISLLINALTEILFLNSLAVFVRSTIEEVSTSTLSNTKNSLFSEIYTYLLNAISFISDDTKILSCIVFIFITILALFIRIGSLRIILFESNFLGTYFESKCSEILLSLDYEESKYLNSSEVMTDLNLIRIFVSGIIQNFLQSLSAFFIVSFISIYLILYGSKLYLFVFLLVIILYTLIGKLSSDELGNISKKVARLQTKRTSAINYMLRMFRHLLLNEEQKNTIASLRSSVTPLYQNYAYGGFLSLYPKIFIEYIVIILVIITLFIQILTTNINSTLENTGILLFAFLRITPSLQLIYLFISSLKKEKYSIESVYRLLTINKNISNKNDFKNNVKNFPLNNKNIDSIELKNIYFKYSKSNTTTINNFSSIFKKGKSYAILGESGSGKSTIVDLMLFLLKPQSGEIFLDNNRDLTQITHLENKYRIQKKSLLIGQNDFNYGSYVRDFLNLPPHLEKDKITLRKLKKAIKCLNMEKIFEKNIFNTYIGENGSKLSGGQIQRIFLIKAYLSKKQIIFFDEATSALDKENEKRAIDLLFDKEFFDPQRILIFSTHSPEIAKVCDHRIKI